MKKYSSKVNVFCGSDDFDLSHLSGIASSWKPIRINIGNTHPGAQLPFGKLSVCAYSGAFTTGYGKKSTVYAKKDVTEKNGLYYLYNEKRILGLSHIHQSGVGAIGYYYNYAVSTAFYGDMARPELHYILKEEGKPGYYCVTDADTNIKYEATIDENSVRHRYTFEKDNGRVMINFANDGLLIDRFRYSYWNKAGDAKLSILDENTVLAEVVLQGIKLYFCVTCKNAKVKLWNDYKENDLKILETNGDKSEAFGCVFDICAKEAELKMSVSLKSLEKAKDDMQKSIESFETLCENALEKWDEALSKIDIEADENDKEIFYSNFYHTLVKPSDWSGENVYSDEEDFAVDFATLWDIYKTQTPLIFTIYPEISRKICRTFLMLSKKNGVMPNTFGLTSKMNVEAKQARLLAAYLFCDAFYRKVEGVDFNEVVEALYREITADEYKPFFENGELERATYTLDISESCGNISDVARQIGRNDISQKLMPYANNDYNVFDRETGLLKEDYEYYEGTHWSYSFRPLRDNNKRVAICGEEKYIELLDRFFGFTHSDDTTYRFQGFNNETDMEAPFAYAYASRHDKVCEIIDAMKDLFSKEDDGMPGNADSGGLTACYIWNSIGIFPVTGQNLMMIGSPKFKKVSITLNNEKVFVVKREGEGIYVKNAYLNGKKLGELKFAVTDMMCGGVLKLEMTTDKNECQKK